jgi:ferric-dicitrate binding protein FerR (iron transport regulator)
MNMEADKKTIEIIRYLQGEMTPEQVRMFLAWKEGDPLNKELFEQVSVVWKLSAEETMPSFDTDAGWNRFRRNMTKLPEDKNTRRLLLSTGWFQRIAAGIILIVGLSVGWHYYSLRTNWQEFNASNGEKKEMTLPDGSIVALMNQSQLIYPESFNGNNRVVKLDGMAYFDVAHDQEKAFKIITKEAEITVLGTAFSVDIDPATGKTEVVVLRGSVRLQPADSKKYVEIRKGESSTWNSSTRILSKPSKANTNKVAWYTNELKFNDMPMNQVVRDLSEFYGIRLDISQTSIQDCRFTSPLGFKNTPVEKVLEALSYVFQMKVERLTSNTYKLIGGTCK